MLPGVKWSLARVSFGICISGKIALETDVLLTGNGLKTMMERRCTGITVCSKKQA